MRTTTERRVRVVVEEQVVTRGKEEYVTQDGWIGVREDGGRIDEWPASVVEVER